MSAVIELTETWAAKIVLYDNAETLAIDAPKHLRISRAGPRPLGIRDFEKQEGD